LFEELREIQHIWILPVEQLQLLAGKIHLPLSQIHAVASFYPHFGDTATQAGCAVCGDMTCHIRGGPR